MIFQILKIIKFDSYEVIVYHIQKYCVIYNERSDEQEKVSFY